MALMAQKLDASLALEGQFSAEGLAAMSAESGSMTMELAKSLVENLDFGDAERVWERFRSEPPEPCDELPADDEPQFIRKTNPNSPGGRMFTPRLNPSPEATLSKAYFSRPKFAILLVRKGPIQEPKGFAYSLHMLSSASTLARRCLLPVYSPVSPLPPITALDRAGRPTASLPIRFKFRTRCLPFFAFRHS